jgi:hypothetical protein
MNLSIEYTNLAPAKADATVSLDPLGTAFKSSFIRCYEVGLEQSDNASIYNVTAILTDDLVL